MKKLKSQRILIKNKNCGGKDCDPNELFQTRSRICEPSGCNIETGSQCVNDPSCVPVFETETPLFEEKVTIMHPSAPEETAPQKSLLASLDMVWEEITQSVFLVIIVILCLIGLVFIGVKEWRLFQKKRKRQIYERKICVNFIFKNSEQ